MKFELGDYICYNDGNQQKIDDKLLELGESLYSIGPSNCWPFICKDDEDEWVRCEERCEDLKNNITEEFMKMLEAPKETDTDMENCKTPSEENLECCEGGEVSAGCFHDHCEGSVEKATSSSQLVTEPLADDLGGSEDVIPVTEWGCFQQVADVLGEEHAEYELNKVRQQWLDGCEELELEVDKPLGYAFYWHNASQGDSFWCFVEDGRIPDFYHSTPDVPPTPECDIKRTEEPSVKCNTIESLQDTPAKSIGELIEGLYFKMAPTSVCITLQGDGTILLHGEKVPTVDVSKLEAGDIDKAYEALVTLEGLFVDYQKGV